MRRRIYRTSEILATPPSNVTPTKDQKLGARKCSVITTQSQPFESSQEDKADIADRVAQQMPDRRRKTRTTAFRLCSSAAYDEVRDASPPDLLGTGTIVRDIRSSVPPTSVATFVPAAMGIPGNLMFPSNGNGGGTMSESFFRRLVS